MRRRDFVCAFGGIALGMPARMLRIQQLLTLPSFYSIAAFAQSAKIARVAWISIDPPNTESPLLLGFRHGIRSLGWTEGRDIAIDTWWGHGSRDRLVQLVPDIVASRPDVIVAAGSPPVRPLIDANVAPPIVFVFSADVVLGKVVQDWARPGVNRTGISFFSLELVPKRLELIKEVMPGLKRVAIVGWPPHPGELLELDAAATAAAKLGIEHRYFGVNTAAELDAAFDAIAQWKADALLAFSGTWTTAYPDRFAAFALRHRIPAVSAFSAFAEKGNLMSYGPVLREIHARLAWFVDRILKGANPSQMPVERPTRFELVINIKAAKALGITIPQSVLLRADQRIE
jgi:putative ABC transport system substrate-binding protein